MTRRPQEHSIRLFSGRKRTFCTLGFCHSKCLDHRVYIDCGKIVRLGRCWLAWVSGSVSRFWTSVEPPIQILLRFPPKSQRSGFILCFDHLRTHIVISAFFIQIWCIGTYPPHHNIENSLLEKMEDLKIHFEKFKILFSLQNLLKVRGNAVILRY